jgi:hypothetical protein
VFLGAGPFLAVAAGLGAAYAASVEPAGSPAGDAARALGDAAVKVHELDKQHRIMERAKDAAFAGLQVVAHYVHEHNLVERSAVVAGKVACFVAQQVSEQILANRPHKRQLTQGSQSSEE